MKRFCSQCYTYTCWGVDYECVVCGRTKQTITFASNIRYTSTKPSTDFMNDLDQHELDLLLKQYKRRFTILNGNYPEWNGRRSQRGADETKKEAQKNKINSYRISISKVQKR